MTREEFWNIIKKSRQDAANLDEQMDNLSERLDGLSNTELVAFDKNLTQLLVAAYRWDLWGAASLINRGCTEDGFEFFRGWLIAQGQECYEAAIKDPESLCDFAGDGNVECEDMLHLASQTYEEKSGKEMSKHGIKRPLNPSGKEWESEELEEMFPKIYAKYG